MGAKDRREARRKRMYEMLLEATREVARRHGWGGVTIRAIAAEVEMTSAALYRYVDTKDALIAELVSRGFSEMTDAMRVASLTSSEPLRASLQAYVRFASDSPELYQAMFGLAGAASPSPAPEHATLLGYIFADALVREGRLTLPEPTHPLVLSVWASVHGAVALRCAGRVALEEAQVVAVALAALEAAA